MKAKNAVITFSQAAQQHVKVQRAWELFVTGGTPDLREITPVVRDSWIRSRDLRIDPSLPHAPFESLPEDRHELFDQAPWLALAEPIFEMLKPVFNEPHHLLLLGDSEGRILLSHGGTKALPRAEELHAIAGGRWGEEQVGCTAIGASIRAGVPVRTDWFENYCRNWQDWVNQAAPIIDPASNLILGALNIAGFREVGSPGTLNVLLQAISVIRMALMEQEARCRLGILGYYNNLLVRFPKDALLAIDRLGNILTINSATERRLSVQAQQIVGRKIASIKSLVDILGPEASQLSEGVANELDLKQAVVFPVFTDRNAGAVLLLSAAASDLHHESWSTTYSFADLVGQHPAFLECVDLALKTSRQDWPVLLLGESGTGKELFAQAIHRASPRRNGPFVVFSCAGVSEELVGSELFGYVEGSYTGAAKGGNPGKILLADRGTLFLDDIDCMPAKMQASLLRVIEDGRVVPVGATKPRRVDVRVIASSNADLESSVREGRFRPDLYYRLNVLAIRLPSLRIRSSDIPLLATHICSSVAPGFVLTDDALEFLGDQAWPGNIRELRNVILAASLRSDATMITSKELSIVSTAAKLSTGEHAGGQNAIKTLRLTEREQILDAISRSKSVLEAADKLGIHFTTLYRKMRKYGVREQSH